MTTTARPRRGFRPVLMGLAVGIGAVLGVLGTALHAGIWVVGETQGGLVIPWGAALALLICLLAQLWIGLRADSVVESTTMGAVTFSLVTVTMVWPGADQLAVPYSAEAMEALPGPTIASLVWWFGSAGITFVSMLAVRWLIAREPLPAEGPETGSDAGSDARAGVGAGSGESVTRP
ncbi:hypothetical protein [Nesterenkonia halobia]|uniref:Uncharacterized protein n=1 Tax=Nesterenkonia halobia TaxID=37922 RepID=A0ABP6R7T7_9MICC